MERWKLLSRLKQFAVAWRPTRWRTFSNRTSEPKLKYIIAGQKFLFQTLAGGRVPSDRLKGNKNITQNISSGSTEERKKLRKLSICIMRVCCFYGNRKFFHRSSMISSRAKFVSQSPNETSCLSIFSTVRESRG